jgi:hypothetical protein
MCSGIRTKSMKVEAVLDTLFHEHVEEELGVGFDLKKTSTVCGRSSYEVSAKMLRGPVHVGMITEGRG